MFPLQIDAYKHCPICSASLIKSNEHHLECKGCGHPMYINASACADICFVTKKKEVLLGKAVRDPRKGYYDLPGGFLEPGETFEQGAAREAKEETGLTIDPSRLTYLTSTISTYPFKGVTYQLVIVAFTYPITDAEIDQIQASDDIEDLTFYTYDHLPFDQLRSQSTEKALRNIHELELI